MTDKIDDGGQAFPGEQGHIPGDTWNQTWDPGMSLRDWFAGQAPHEEIEWFVERCWKVLPKEAQALAKNKFILQAEARYMWADAMIAEGKKP